MQHITPKKVNNLTDLTTSEGQPKMNGQLSQIFSLIDQEREQKLFNKHGQEPTFEQ